MSDAFDDLLAAALAPPARDPDPAFVLRVRLLCALDDRLRADRRALVRVILVQAVALAAVAAGLLWLGRSSVIAQFVMESPVVALCAALAGFGLLVTTIAASPAGRGHAV